MIGVKDSKSLYLLKDPSTNKTAAIVDVSVNKIRFSLSEMDIDDFIDMSKRVMMIHSLERGQDDQDNA